MTKHTQHVLIRIATAFTIMVTPLMGGVTGPAGPTVPPQLIAVAQATPAVQPPAVKPTPQPVQPAQPETVNPTPTDQAPPLETTKNVPVEPGAGHPNYPYQALLTPNDPGFASQWYSQIENAPKAWDVTTGATQTVIAIIDTGFALNHQEFAGRWATNPGEIGPTVQQGPAPNCTSRGLALDKSCNNIDNDADGYASNWRGWDFSGNDNDPSAGTTAPAASAVFHGTYVAGLAAGSGNNATGYAGVNWGSKIMPLQALSDSGAGFTDTVAAAVRYAADHGANVINLSLGSQFDDAYLRSQINYAISRGVTVVAAAGNDGCNCMIYPANYPEVVSVGASTRADGRATFSSYGANLDLTAPGTDGLCAPTWVAANQTSGYSCNAQGTSFASPQVAGAAALILSQHPGMSSANVSRALQMGSDIPALAGGQRTSLEMGYGRLNLYGSLLQATTPVNIDTTGAKVTTVSLAAGDVSTVCQARGSTCRLLLSGPQGQRITLPAQVPDLWGDVTIYWNPTASGLTLGIWQIDSLDNFGTATKFASISIQVVP